MDLVITKSIFFALQSSISRRSIGLYQLGAGDTFVKVEPCKGPVITGGDVVFIVLFLCIQTFELCIRSVETRQ